MRTTHAPNRAKPLLASGFALLLAACAGTDGPDIDPLAGLNAADRETASRALQEALEGQPDGAELSWSNPATGASGRVAPLSTSVSADGLFCRRYRETLTQDGRTASREGQACRESPGVWSPRNG